MPTQTDDSDTATSRMNDSKTKSDELDIDLLIVDDETDFRESACRYMKRIGFRVDEAEDGEEALNVTTNKKFDVVIMDIHMPGVSGIQALSELMQRESPPKVIMLTGGGTIENAVESIKLGAYDFLTKPAKLDDLARLVKRACEAHELEKENRQLKEVIRRQAPQSDMIGTSPAMQEVFRLIQRVASSDKPVLIQGESGTGKELVSRAIHKSSPLSEKPLVVVNCAALPDQLLESELFGHEKGAFTGAVAAKPGLFEIADGGTLFIDEFGEMSGALQAKLLRVLEDGSMRRVGSVAERKVKVRVIAATNRDLDQEVKDKNFREDLFYRINVLGIMLPPLRQRAGDIRLLAEKFSGPDWSVDEDVMTRLENYSWPGNVRQLQNAIERAKVLAEEDRIELKNLPAAIVESEERPVTAVNAMVSGDIDLETLNKLHVVETYEKCGKNKTKTAQALGINRRSLYRLLEKFEIS
ncbi:sigma-54-dependent transcriptional regulator [Mariniblastus fucicola]|nr:sigma-54 dependent transcriptional regulator [Mariniblastus fucicola]